jgi:hypothetical protein
MMLGAGTLIGEASAPAELPPEPGTIFAVLSAPAPTAAPTPSPVVTPEPAPEEVATAEPEDTATPEPTGTPTPEDTATPEPTETAAPEPAEPPKHVVVVALSGPALDVPGDVTTLDAYDGADLAPFGALAELAPPAKSYVQSLTTPCGDDPSPLYDRERNPLRSLPACSETKLDDLPGDFADPLTAPAFAYVLPDACHDGRDGDWCAGGKTAAQRAEAWLKEWIPQITESPAFADGGALAVVFSEGAAVTPALQAGDSRALVRAMLR